MTDASFDCVLCGSCVVDVLVRPIPLDRPLGGGELLPVDPLAMEPGGIVSNSGTAMARLGMTVAPLSYVGDDTWAGFLRRRYREEGIAADTLLTHAARPTSTTAVLIDSSGERTFAHCVGAPQDMDKQLFLDHLHLFARSRLMLLGYYSLMPGLEPDLPEVFAKIRETGCRTALDAAGSGGGMDPLDRILPHLDIYVPSHNEASHQTGEDDPRAIIEMYRSCGAPGLLGVKLGSSGALLSPSPGELVEVPPVSPPGDVLDTTGAGDSFYAGLLAGVARGLDPQRAGRLAAAAGACCVTAVGAATGIRDFNETARVAGID